MAPRITPSTRAALLSLGLYSCVSLANESWVVHEVVVEKLAAGRVVLLIDGRSQSLKAGETAEGITLVSTDGSYAVLQINGRREILSLGARAGFTVATTDAREVQLWPDTAGMYAADGRINGHPVRLLVDTGATRVAMNAAVAQRLGINYRRDGKSALVETASGVEKAYGISLRTVSLGAIELRDVEALVIEGDYPSNVLLGMSFLGRLEMQRSGRSLTLRARQ